MPHQTSSLEPLAASDAQPDHDPRGKVRLPVGGGVESRAQFSPCRQYRYWLERRWDGRPIGYGGHVLWIGMNPSTADELVDDPTVRKCRKFTTRWGHGAMVMCNSFAYRATYPEMLMEVSDPNGPENDATLQHMAATAALVIVAWGRPPAPLQARGRGVAEILRSAGSKQMCLAVNKDGSPKHPLYIKDDTQPTDWVGWAE